MRYYYYGINKDSTGYNANNEECIIEGDSKKNIDVSNASVPVSVEYGIYASGLIIDDDTVYEIDEECIRCKKKNKVD